MARQVMHAQSATIIMNSPLRHATGALAVSAGFAYVLEAEDQFHRSIWFGVMFAGITGAWFILGSFLALIDAIAVWWSAVVLVVLALGLWSVGLVAVAPGEVDDVGSLDEPLTVLRVLLAILVGASAALTFSMRRRRWPDWLARHAPAAGALVLRGRAGRDHRRRCRTGLFLDRRLRPRHPTRSVSDGCSTRHSGIRVRADRLRIELSARLLSCRFATVLTPA